MNDIILYDIVIMSRIVGEVYLGILGV